MNFKGNRKMTALKKLEDLLNHAVELTNFQTVHEPPVLIAN